MADGFPTGGTFGDGTYGSGPGGEATARRWLLIRQSIETGLADPLLCPDRVAAAGGISTRHLHRLFRQTGTSFGGYLRRRRLERCRADLADPALSALTVTAIAFRWGFSESAHFSRCFRAAYGITAREFRAACRRLRADAPVDAVR